MIVYVYMYYTLVRLSGCLNHIKGTIVIIFFIFYYYYSKIGSFCPLRFREGPQILDCIFKSGSLLNML